MGDPSDPSGSVRGVDEATSVIRSFLIADVRGYTLFTQERGDEAAAALAARFARVTREVIEARSGSLLELRGDEALAVFDSPRQAIRAAVDLQERFVRETLDDPSLPLPVGIGVDAGEAVAVEGGYRGGALNLAARLCGLAGPGEVLLSGELTHLARRVEGTVYADRGEYRLKGLAEPVRAFRVLPEAGPDPAEQLATYRVAPTAKTSPWSRVRWPFVTAAAALVALLVAVLLATRATGPTRTGASPTVGVGGSKDEALRLNAKTGKVVAEVAVPSSLSYATKRVVIGQGGVWVVNGNGTISEIDPRTNTSVATIRRGADVAVGDLSVWIVDVAGAGGQERPVVYRLNPATARTLATIRIPRPNAGTTHGFPHIAFGYGAVWCVPGGEAFIARIDTQTNAVERIPLPGNPNAVAVGGGSVWVTYLDVDFLSRIDPGSDHVVKSVGVAGGANGIAVGEGAVWTIDADRGVMTRIDPGTLQAVDTLQAGTNPVSGATGGGFLWVVSGGDGKLLKIDPSNGETVKTVVVGGHPDSIAISGDTVWIAAKTVPSRP